LVGVVWSSRLGVEQRANNLSSEKKYCYDTITNQASDTDKWIKYWTWKTVELKIAAWNTTSLLRTSACQNLVDTGSIQY